MPAMPQLGATTAMQWLADLQDEPASTDSTSMQPCYRFGPEDEYEVTMPASMQDRQRAWHLVHRSYLAKGYASPDPEGLWYSLHDALPSTRLFRVTRRGRDVATLKLVFDSPIGLPADGLYGRELDAMRRNGRRLCEIAALVSEETDRGRCLSVLQQLFRIAYLDARRISGATDFVITVNPHHAAYYQRKLLFQEAGERRSYSMVGGAPAVLLSLDLETAEARYEARYGAGEGSFFRGFVNPSTEPALLQFLRQPLHGMTAADIHEYFCIRRPLLARAGEFARAYVEALYGMGRPAPAHLEMEMAKAAV